jgi:hypothetical protein
VGGKVYYSEEFKIQAKKIIPNGAPHSLVKLKKDHPYLKTFHFSGNSRHRTTPPSKVLYPTYPSHHDKL